MIDEENLLSIAEALFKEVQQTGMPEDWLLVQKQAQEIIKDEQIYALILVVKWADNSNVPTDSNLIQNDLINATKELEKLTAGIEDYDFIERDVQHFIDLQGKKYTLSVVIRLYDY